ncbi:MAG: prolipoprotein diacylglyceryl transferase [Clostridia bacterium]|nr:prolipoprotein diacylglyceryl transferase [Clostridia bacterium]
MEPFALGSFTVYPFGLVMALGTLAALLWTGANLRRAGLKAETASWFAVFSLPLAFVFARLGYCLMIVDQLIGDEDFAFILRVSEGGFILWGAVLGGWLAAWLTGRITRQSAGSIADAAILPACLLIALGRIAAGLIFKDQGIGFELAEWFNPEETDWASRYSLLALEDFSLFEHLPFAVTNYYGDWCWAIFVPEALWALVMALLLRRGSPRPGGRTARFILLYACSQITFEAMLRGEVLHLPWLGFVRANQILCAAAILIVWGLALTAVPKPDRLRVGGLSLLQMLLAVGVIIAMEFAAFEKKISAIDWMPADVCHLIMAAACVWLYFAVRPLWKRRWA